MTTRNRAPRRGRVFTTTQVSLTLVAGDISTASQQSTNQMTSDFETRTGRLARGVTVARIWIRAFYFTLAVITAPSLAQYSLGMGIFTQGIDNGDFPDVDGHVGDWMVHDARTLTDLAISTAPTPLVPNDGSGAGSSVVIDNRSMRKLPRVSDDLFLVLQKASTTEDNIQFRAAVTVMWLVD